MRGLGVLMLALPAVAAAARLETTVTPREARVGDPIRLEVKVFLPDGAALKSPERPERLGSLDVLDFSIGEPSPNGGEKVQSLTYTLAAYEVGVTTVPALAVELKRADGSAETMKTPEIPVPILSVLGPDSKDIRDIKGPVGVVPWAVLSVLLGAVLASSAAWLFWKRRRDEKGANALPARPAHETALEALQALESAPASSAKAFYSRLSDILRAYLEARFDLPTLDRTTSEIFQEMRKKVPMDLCVEPREVLETSDLAKFAKLEPEETERRRDLGRVKDFVLRTRPVEPPATPPA